MTTEDPDSLAPESNSQAAAPQAVDVADILKANLRVQQRNEAPLDLEPKKYRKKRDYWLCMCVVNVGLLVLPPLFLKMNVLTVVSSLAAVVVFSAGFSWIMWQVVNDY